MSNLPVHKFLINLQILTVLSVLQVAIAPQAKALQFQNIEVNQDDVIAIASPLGTGGYQLVMIEQLSSTQDCWAEDGDTVTPLLLEFDFFGICDRVAGNSGYSLRVADEDLGFQYGVRLVPDNNTGTLRLQANSNRNLTAPAIEVGQATLRPGEIVAITLNPGWRITKRSYNGQAIRHYYFTNDQPLSALLNSPTPTSPPSPTPTPTPSPTSSPALTPTPSPTLPLNPASSPMPTTIQLPSPPVPRIAEMPAPAPTNFSQLPVLGISASVSPPQSRQTQTLPLLPTSPLPLPQSILVSAPQPTYVYRVLVRASTLELQEQVQALVPDAFRRVVNNELVMQVGLFSDRQAAVYLQEQLQEENLTVIIQEELATL